ncbi:hypothetical protein E2562_005096 [Oryza meyeriana var. granulata]|uniref:VQ domain-containing protein n=1 Tax=Oryza meyeriana var. granulata TaxID=110450 RepID=A0A6G1BTB2_9ORYZ|nr:hypothetical protein E2562_005096 [Oryza meyeriana var. granulata]
MKHHAMKSPSRASSSAMGSTHKFSHAIAKAPPRKIRIVHVLAPEVIKTDARHFRELVQRLTGKPAAADGTAASPSQPDPCDTAGDEGSFVADGAGAAATIKAEAKVEEAEAAAAAEGFLHALGEEDRNDVLLQWLEGGFCIDMDAVSF